MQIGALGLASGEFMCDAIYARKSTAQDSVAEEAKSVTRQIENAKAYATKRGWNAPPPPPRKPRPGTRWDSGPQRGTEIVTIDLGVRR